MYNLKQKSEKLSRAALYNLYWQENKSIRKIAEETGVNEHTILRWMRGYNIKSKTLSQSQFHPENYPSKEELKQLYDKLKSLRAVTKELRMNRTTVRGLYSRYNISLIDKGKSISFVLLKGKKIPSKEELQELISQGKSDRKIARDYDLDHTTIIRLRRKYNIVKNLGQTSPSTQVITTNNLLTKKLIEQRQKTARASSIESLTEDVVLEEETQETPKEDYEGEAVAGKEGIDKKEEPPQVKDFRGIPSLKGINKTAFYPQLSKKEFVHYLREVKKRCDDECLNYFIRKGNLSLSIINEKNNGWDFKKKIDPSDQVFLYYFVGALKEVGNTKILNLWEKFLVSIHGDLDSSIKR